MSPLVGRSNPTSGPAAPNLIALYSWSGGLSRSLPLVVVDCPSRHHDVGDFIDVDTAHDDVPEAANGLPGVLGGVVVDVDRALLLVGRVGGGDDGVLLGHGASCKRV